MKRKQPTNVKQELEKLHHFMIFMRAGIKAGFTFEQMLVIYQSTK